MSIRVEHLTKRFGAQTVVNNISFNADEKGVIGFLGPNGAGKSTTMKMITGYLAPESGKVLVCGIPVQPDGLETRQKIGYLPEGNPLYHEMYVREYLSFIASAEGVKTPRQRIEEVIHLTGLHREANKKTGQLSKGYKQRVGLAAAILNDPDVLILDEPTSGLDPNQIVEIRELIRTLGKTKTVLFSSHILQEVESICERVIIINKGNIVADDRIENLKSNTGTSSVVSVKFSPDPADGWLQNFADVSKVSEINGIHHLETAQPEKLKKQLLAYSLQNDLNIISLDSHSESLEDIFKTLTIQNNSEK